MSITLQSLVPVPLKEKLIHRNSDVWNANLAFENGEHIKIKAPSGTGKTTLIHILYKLRDDYEGTVFWSDTELKKINKNELSSLRQSEASIIFQDLRLFPNLTAKENIELKRVMQKPFYKENKIEEMAEQLGIAHILQQRAVLCSYGEQQRIAIIRALMQPFSWLLMDEPFSHLDIDNTAKAAALIAEECKIRNAGFILTDLDEDAHFTYTKQLHL